jgi:hypothetical protein
VQGPPRRRLRTRLPATEPEKQACGSSCSTYSDGLGFRVDPFDDYVILFKELKELCALFHYEKLAKDLWLLCGLVNCRT